MAVEGAEEAVDGVLGGGDGGAALAGGSRVAVGDPAVSAPHEAIAPHKPPLATHHAEIDRSDGRDGPAAADDREAPGDAETPQQETWHVSEPSLITESNSKDFSMIENGEENPVAEPLAAKVPTAPARIDSKRHRHPIPKRTVSASAAPLPITPLPETTDRDSPADHTIVITPHDAPPELENGRDTLLDSESIQPTSQLDLPAALNLDAEIARGIPVEFTASRSGSNKRRHNDAGPAR